MPVTSFIRTSLIGLFLTFASGTAHSDGTPAMSDEEFTDLRSVMQSLAAASPSAPGGFPFPDDITTFDAMAEHLGAPQDELAMRLREGGHEVRMMIDYLGKSDPAKEAQIRQQITAATGKDLDDIVEPVETIIRRVLKSGEIANDAEHYVAQRLLSGTNPVDPFTFDQSRLETIAQDYEVQVGGN